METSMNTAKNVFKKKIKMPSTITMRSTEQNMTAS